MLCTTQHVQSGGATVGTGTPTPVEAISRSITAVNVVQPEAEWMVSRAFSVVNFATPDASAEAFSRAVTVVNRVLPTSEGSVSRAWSVCNRVEAGAADFDCDGDVDLVDFALFSQCFSGADNPPAGTCPPGVDADLDDDDDVDLADFAIFAQQFTGSN